MSRQYMQVDVDTLYSFYIAGFNHGANGGHFPEESQFLACQKMINGESGHTVNINKNYANIYVVCNAKGEPIWNLCDDDILETNNKIGMYFNNDLPSDHIIQLYKAYKTT